MSDIRLTLRTQEYCEVEERLVWKKRNTIQIDSNFSYHYWVENCVLRFEIMKEKKEFTEEELTSEKIDSELDEVQRILDESCFYEK